jgi:hypothetical protein
VDDEADDTDRLAPMLLPVGLMFAIGAACVVVALGIRGNLVWVAAFLLLVGGGLGAMRLLAPAVRASPDEHQRDG